MYSFCFLHEKFFLWSVNHCFSYQVVYEHLGSLLACVITLDEIVIANSILHQHWGAYRRLVRSSAATAADPRLAFDRGQLQPLEKMLGDIETAVMQGTMFQV